jgi:hypothetical protein
MKKLIDIQNELKAPKNQYNSFGKYKYRSCEDILEAVKPLLAKHGCTLTITDEIKEVGGLVYVEAVAIIAHGVRSVYNDGSQAIVQDNIVCVKAQAGIDPNRKGMDIAQSFGSSSSYARKYALNGLFLIDDTKDADATNDHGKATPQLQQAKPTVAKSATVPKGERVIVSKGDDIYNAIVKALSNNKGTLEQAIEKYNISQDVQKWIKAEVILAKESFEKA